MTRGVWLAGALVAASIAAASPPALAQHNPGPYRGPVRAVPLSLGVSYGFLNTTRDGSGESYGAYHMWLGYRYRPIPESFGPFIAVGVEGTLSSYPLAQRELNTISAAPTVHVGLDWVPENRDSVWPELSLFSFYFVGAYIIGPPSAFDHGQRVGAGITFVPVTLYSGLPNTVEVVHDSYVRDGQRENLWHLKVGWGF